MATKNTNDDETQYTPAILNYRITKLEESLAEQFLATQKGLEKIETKLDMYHANFVSRQIFDEARGRANEIHDEMRKDYQQDHKAINTRVTRLEEWNTWVIRIALGIILAAIIGSVIITTK